MEECSLDLMFFFLIRDRPFVFFLMEEGFFQQLKSRIYFKQSESIYFL